MIGESGLSVEPRPVQSDAVESVFDSLTEITINNLQSYFQNKNYIVLFNDVTSPGVVSRTGEGLIDRSRGERAKFMSEIRDVHSLIVVDLLAMKKFELVRLNLLDSMPFGIATGVPVDLEDNNDQSPHL